MKPWIKDLIKSKKFGYLSINTGRSIRILPYEYKYKSGRLVGALSILQSNDIVSLNDYPTHSLTIVDKGFTIDMIGKVKLNFQNLDNFQQLEEFNEDTAAANLILNYIQSGNPSEIERLKSLHKFVVYSHDLLNTALFRIPHLAKGIVIEFIPSRIIARDTENESIFNMEII